MSADAAPPAAVDKSKAACEYMEDLNKLTTKFKTAVGCDTGAVDTPPPPLPTPEKKLAKADIEAWLANKVTKNNFLKDASVTESGEGSFDIKAGDKTFTLAVSAGTIDDQANNIAAALGPDGTTAMAGGRRGKRSARRSFRSSKGGRRSRKGKKGGRRSRGCKCSKSCKCRKCRGRTNKRR